MHGAQAWRPLAGERLEDLLADERKVQRALRGYKAFSRAAVFCGIVVPILAGSTVLASSGHIGGRWPILAGALTLVASILVAIHKGLDCDAFHAKCHEALAELRALAVGYEGLLNAPPPGDSRAAFDGLEARLADYYKAYARVLPVRPTRVMRGTRREPDCAGPPGQT